MEHIYSKNRMIADYYSEHYDELKNYVESRLHTVSGTDDIVQNIFVRLLQMDKMITPVTLPSLVYTTVRNLMVDYWRHKQIKDEYEHFLCKGDGLSKYAEDTESIYSVMEVNEILERGIARLSDTEKKIYRLNFQEGLRVRDIATKLDLSYKNTENKLGVARKIVRSYVRRVLVG